MSKRNDARIARSSDDDNALAAPGRGALFGEARAALDALRMIGPLFAATLRQKADRRDAAVVVVPGFGADDRATAPLRYYLGSLGYTTEGWGLGRNLAGTDLPHTIDDVSSRWQIERRPDYRGEGSVPYLADRFIDRLQHRHRELGRPLALIGWSLGGYLAREAARDLPDTVQRVITLGSPIVGGPKYTAAAPYFRRRGMDLDWIEREVAKRESNPITQPITAIYSKSDAIVSWQATIDRHSSNVNHVEVDAAHLGLALNPTVWRHIVAALDSHAPRDDALSPIGC